MIDIIPAEHQHISMLSLAFSARHHFTEQRHRAASMAVESDIIDIRNKL